MIEAINLTKYYGDFPAIENVSFSAEKGEVVGFLGPNGSGKTTTMRILTGYMPPTAGTATVAGYDVVTNSLDARRHIGYLPETVPLYLDMTVKSYLGFQGSLRGMASKKIQGGIEKVIELCHLEDYYTTDIAKLSKGFRQRVGIAQALLHDPAVLILDEPTLGIDPRQVVETRQIIKGLGGEHTVILSSHILAEVSMVCDRVLIIHEGRIVAMDRPEDLARRLEGVSRVVVEVRGPLREVEAALRQIKGVERVSRVGPEDRVRFQIECAPTRDLRPLIAQAVTGKGWGLIEMQAGGLSLEDIFLRLTEETEASKGGRKP